MSLAIGTVWEVRTTGNNNNSGGFVPGGDGTDYSQQDSAQVTFDGTTITATNTAASATIVLVGRTVEANDVNNTLKVSGGTNFTAGIYHISSVNVGANTWTLDRNVTTGAGSAMTGAMGGALATPAQAIANVVSGSTLSANNTIWLQAGTYTQTTPTVFAGSIQSLSVKAYTSSRGDATTNQPVTITTATNSTRLFTFSNITTIYGVMWHNIYFSNSAGTRAEGFYAGTGGAGNSLVFENCVLDGFSIGIRGDFNTDYYFNTIILVNTIVKNCTSHGIHHVGGTVLLGSTLRDNGGHGLYVAGTNALAGVFCARSLFRDNSSDGVNINIGYTHTYAFLNCIFYSNTGSGLEFATSQQKPGALVVNCVFDSNGDYGIKAEVADGDVAYYSVHKNAFYNNTTGARLRFPAGADDITLTSSPFTDPGANNFSLNSTAGGGADLVAAGYPSTLANIGTSAPDVGAVQVACEECEECEEGGGMLLARVFTGF